MDLPKEQTNQRREEKKEIIRKVKELRSGGMTIEKIAQTMNLAKGTVIRYLCLDEERASRRKSVKWHGYDKYESLLVDLLSQGKKAVEILNILREKGVAAGRSTIFLWISKLKKQSGHPKTQKKQQQGTWLKSYDMCRHIWSYKEKLGQKEKEALDKLLNQFPIAHRLYQVIQNFRHLLKERDSKQLTTWIEEALQCDILEIIKFAKGLQQSFDEVYNAFIYPYSNGLVEGHINRLKMLKRMMFGRAKLDLLRQRVLYQI